MKTSSLSTSFARCSLFIIYVWFGLLKIIGLSPAEKIVAELLEKTLPIIPFSHFIIVFGIFEVLIGTLFLFPRFTRLATVLFSIHMVTTFLPLFMVPVATWQGWLVPTLTGQYIIKNLALISVVLYLRSTTARTLSTV